MTFFISFSESKLYDEAIRLLLPPGKDPPPPFGLTVSGEQSHSMRKKSEHLLTSSVSALMICCSKMLTSSYSVQVLFLRGFVPGQFTHLLTQSGNHLS